MGDNSGNRLLDNSGEENAKEKKMENEEKKEK